MDTYVQKTTHTEVAQLWSETVTSQQNESFSVRYQVPVTLHASLPRLPLLQTAEHVSALFSVPAATEHHVTRSYTLQVRRPHWRSVDHTGSAFIAIEMSPPRSQCSNALLISAVQPAQCSH